MRPSPDGRGQRRIALLRFPQPDGQRPQLLGRQPDRHRPDGRNGRPLRIFILGQRHGRQSRTPATSSNVSTGSTRGVRAGREAPDSAWRSYATPYFSTAAESKWRTARKGDSCSGSRSPRRGRRRDSRSPSKSLAGSFNPQRPGSRTDSSPETVPRRTSESPSGENGIA